MKENEVRVNKVIKKKTVTNLKKRKKRKRKRRKKSRP